MPNSNGQLALELVFELTDELLADEACPPLDIGIGSPSLMNARNGTVSQAVNLDREDLPLRDLLETRYKVPVHLANDSHAAALGNYTFSPDRGTKNLIVVKVGREISAGIVLKGHLDYGDCWGAGEMGHVRTVEQ